jgi:HK97 family phage major capsid protein
MTKEELLTLINKNSAEMLDKVKDSWMDIFNEKLEKLSKVEDNKMKGGYTEQLVEDKIKKEGKWESFGEQLQAVKKAYAPEYKEVDSRLIDIKAISGSNEGIGAEGGFFVAPEFSAEILQNMHEKSVIANDCRHIQISGNSIVINAINETSRATGSRWGGVRGYWVAEGGDLTKSKVSLRRIELKLNKMGALNYSTEELLEDQSALTSITTQAVGEEFAFMLDDAILNGTGAGQPLGVRNSASLKSTDKDSGQTAATFTADNVMNMYNNMPAANRTKAKWYLIQDVEPWIWKLNLKIGTAGVPLFMPPTGLISVPSGTLFGRPLQVVEQCQTLGSEGDILLLDLSQYLIIEKTGGIKSASSIHVRFVNDEQTFRFTYRVDGQPMWNSTLTAYNSGATRSPYVTLAVRA